MASPCPRCDETKTDPVWNRAMYKLVWAFGYRLHRCSRCRALRFIPRHRGNFSRSSQLGNDPGNAPGFAEERRAIRTAEAPPELKKDQVTATDNSDRDLRCCPTCGSTKYHRTRRTTMERMLRRPSMARCENCGIRFPYPGPREEYPGALEFAGVEATLHCPEEESGALGLGEEGSGPEVAEEATVVVHPNHGLRCCPACGSPKYHRTRRTIMERMLRRPPMARCESCRMRFLYPWHYDESPDSVKSGAAASVGHVGEEEKVSRRAEESSQLNAAQHGSAADSSDWGLNCCPVCGSTAYRRSRRTTLERLLLRPPMARCRNCSKRFPYPEG
jgi:hypothetical protein